MKKIKKNENNLNDYSVKILYIVGLITLFLLCFWVFILWSRKNDLPWYTDLLSGGTTSFFFAFIIMFFQNRFQQLVYARDSFYKSIKRYGIKDMHHDKKTVLSNWIKDAEKEIYITGYRLIITFDLLNDLIYALNKSKELTVKILTCPPWTDTYKKIFDDDYSINYLLIFKKLKENILDFDKRISFKYTDKPLFNDTYIVDDHLITSPYVHNKNKTNERLGVITADKFFSLEIIENSSLFNFFKEDFMSVWENKDTKDIDFEIFNSTEIMNKIINPK